uniref:Gustatory receptor n=1 Tax=Anopheles funestus TaxID=62324 RepID=A0A182RQX2_ANOFN
MVESMQVLNIFHALFITNVRVVRQKGHTFGYKIARAHLQLLLPLVAVIILLFFTHNTWLKRGKQCIYCLNWFTVIGRMMTTMAVVILLIIDNFRQRHKLLTLLQNIPTAGSSKITHRGRYSVKRLQLSILLLCNIFSVMELISNMYRNHQNRYMWGILSGVLIEHYILLNSLLCQLLAETITKAYESLEYGLLTRPITTVTNEMKILEQCKDQLANVIGMKLLLVLLHLLFNVSFCTYDILQKVLNQEHVYSIIRLMIITVQETVMLFGLCFYYSMLDLKILNWFNHFLVSPIYLHREIETDRYIFRTRHLYWNAAILMTLVILSSLSAVALVLKDLPALLTSVMGIVTLSLYGIRLVVSVPLVIWTLANNRALVDISNRALHIERQLSSDKSRNGRGRVRLLIQTQLCIGFSVFFSNFGVQMYYVYLFPIYRRFLHIAVLFGFMGVESVIFVHQTYVQFWPAFLSNRYAKLINLIDYKDQKTLDTVLALSSVLENFKKQFAAIFGLVQLCHLMNLFVTCSVEMYVVLYAVDEGETILAVAMNLYTSVAYGSSFLICTYVYDLINVKTGRYIFRSRNVCWNAMLLTVITACSCVSTLLLILDLLLNQLVSVMGATTIILYAMRLLVIVPLILWALFYNRKLVNDCNCALNIIQEKYSSLIQIRNGRNILQLLSGQISIIVIVLLAVLVGHCNILWKFERLRNLHYVFNVCALTFFEFITLMHLMVAQYWTLFIGQHIQELVRFIKAEQSPTVLRQMITLWDELQYFKQSIASTFGVLNVLHTLDALVTCAVETYTIFYVYELGLGLESACSNMGTLILYTGSFYAFAYAHDLVENKLKFLNWFNYLLISPFYLCIDSRTNRLNFLNRNLFGNALILAIPLIICTAASFMLLLRDLHLMFQSVASATSMILHTIRLFAIMLLLVWTLVHNSKLKENCNHALHIVTEMCDRFKCRIERRNSLLVLKVQIYMNVAILAVAFWFQTYKMVTQDHLYELNHIIVGFGVSVTEFILSVHRVYVQFWATFLHLQYDELVLWIKTNQCKPNFYKVIALVDEMESLKRSLSNNFGPIHILHIANIFLTHLSVLNIFNHLCVSLIFVEQSPKGVTVRRKNVFRNILLLTVAVSIVCYLGLMRTLNHFREMVGSVTEIVHLLKYSINGQIICTILRWMYQYSDKVVEICNKTIAINDAIRRLHIVRELVERHTLLKLLIVVSILMRCSFLGMHIYLQFIYGLSYEMYVVLHGSVLVDLTIDLQKVFLLYFAWYLTKRYETVMFLLGKADVVVIYTIFEDILALKKHLSQTFGVLLLVLILQTFLACSIHAYLIIVQTVHSFQVCANVAQLLINLLLFYMLTYSYDCVATKEAELKNALKSMQYTNIKKQTRDQKDFYDLVNLKLMMESPKITACGLFEINLQIFYNVFAAIITYIVILFQFRGFEKSP